MTLCVGTRTTGSCVGGLEQQGHVHVVTITTGACVCVRVCGD